MLDQWEEQSYNCKQKRHPGQKIIERNYSSLKPTSSAFGVNDEQGDVHAVFKRMAFSPVIGGRAVYSLIDFFKVKKRKVVCQTSNKQDRSPHVRESGLRNLADFCLWNSESRALESGIQFKESGIQVLLVKIRSPVPGIRNPQHGIQNPRLSWNPLYGAKTEATGISTCHDTCKYSMSVFVCSLFLSRKALLCVIQQKPIQFICASLEAYRLTTVYKLN